MTTHVGSYIHTLIYTGYTDILAKDKGYSDVMKLKVCT